MRSGLRLVADVGGTNVRFALADLASPSPRLADPRGFPRADFATLEEAIDRYLPPRTATPWPRSVVVAVAGPVADGRVNLTNGRWCMDETTLRGHGFAQARLINDYEALALSIRRLGAADLGAIGDPRPSAIGSAVVLGAGTGLGVAALVRDGLHEAIAVTEGGHIAFAPHDETEIEILRVLTSRFGRISLERLLSGPGLVNLRWALGRTRDLEVEPLAPDQIVELAAAGRDPLCTETLDRFCALYGAAAGDFALAYGAVGGVYLGGGIAPRMLERLRGGAVERRTTSSEGGRTSAATSWSQSAATAPSIRLLAAKAAISTRGWRMVVSCGRLKRPPELSSNPATEMSSGIDRPASAMAASAPSAMSSLLAKMAVGRVSEASSAVVTVSPDSKVKAPCSIQASGTGRSWAAMAARKPSRRARLAA